jgi:prepilin-type N-terminal cleavage/methylation domain-containing protein
MGICVGRADKNKSNTRAIGTTDRAAGFTLLELLFAVMLAAIVIGIGSPAFSDFRRNAQLTRQTNEFLTVVQQARSEAAKRQQPISICVADTSGEEPACSGGPLTGFAASGWLMFEDRNRDCARTVEEPVLRLQPPFERLAVAASSDRSCISFATNGFLRKIGADEEAEADEERRVYQALFCDPTHPASSAFRGFTLSPSGHARVTRDPDEIAATELSCPSV